MNKVEKFIWNVNQQKKKKKTISNRHSKKGFYLHFINQIVATGMLSTKMLCIEIYIENWIDSTLLKIWF